MPSFSDTAQIVIFAGGRGSSNIISALKEHERVRLTVLVNAYDDGLSTGRLRQFIPGMLGPSDIRKNATTLMAQTDRSSRALRTLLEYRFPDGAERTPVRAALQRIADLKPPSSFPEIGTAFLELSLQAASTMAAYLRTFLDYETAAEGPKFDYGDCSLGNLVFAGAYLSRGRDFNAAIGAITELCEIPGQILNVTDGSNLVLTALKQDGNYLKNEAEIVSQQSSTPISELNLFPDYLREPELAALSRLPAKEKAEFLAARSVLPRANPEALQALAGADLIVYGPGTQHSSLLPSYLTLGVAESIESNAKAARVYVANILHDHDIPNLRIDELLKAFEHYMSRKQTRPISLPRLVSTCLVQQADAENLNWRASGSYVQVDIGALGGIPGDIIMRDWESERGRHVGDHVADLLIRTLSAAFEIPPVRHRISIVVPALDEERTIGKVLGDLAALRLPWTDVAKEILVVDGGSTDGTLEIAGRAAEVRVYSLPRGSGRGAALRYGFARARGNVVVVYPSDGEYFAHDLPKVVAPIMKNEFKVVFGSRAIKCLDLGGRLHEIYGADRLGYGLSKYGGTLISLACMFLHNRYVSDPLTSFKAFDAELLRSLKLGAVGVELEGEIIANLSRQREFILEVPVDYVPRNRAQGKKIRTIDGLRTLWLLIRTGLARRWTRTAGR